MLVSAHMDFQMAFWFCFCEVISALAVSEAFKKPLAHREGVVNRTVIGGVIDGRCYILTFVTSGEYRTQTGLDSLK